ncbi:MAG: hypothetical protein EOP48_33635 [Sphingobacteriales bacterium]|nr:MAG: hypothetical protein EOP48_33635 [Sphingobacteriales bacterium]
MKKSKRLKLTTSQTVTHYGIVFLLLFIVSLTGWSLIEIYVTNTYTGVRPADELIKTSLPFLVLAVFFAIIQYRRLMFKEVNLTFTDAQFQEAVERTTKHLGWRIECNHRTFFRAYRPWNWSGSWGEMVTIIKDEECLLVNSICNPDNMSSITSFGWNRKNIQVFVKNLTEVLNNKSAEIEIEKMTNEWRVKRILIRLFTYPFSIFLIAFGVYMAFQPLTVRSIIAGLGAITVASIYLFSDIKILTTNNGNDSGTNR